MGSGSPVKKLAVLGSTGSIGQQTLDVVRSFPRNFKVIALSAGSNTELLRRQVAEFQPEYYYCDEGQVIPGARYVNVTDLAALENADLVVMAIGGTAGLFPTLAAVRAGKKIALSNKESLVMAGEIITRELKNTGAELLPVDSEHSAIWQCLRGESQISKLILTASGGPFSSYGADQLKTVTPEQALKHPSWKMGKKITIDSATLMNKGLEVIEARWLFDVPIDNIDIVIHPQSIVHSMVEFVDGSIKAQLSNPDMRLPILHALSYPGRLPFAAVPRIDWNKTLNFTRPDWNKCPCLNLAIEAGKKGGTYPAVLCSADETAIDYFLKGTVRFTDIAVLVEMTLSAHVSKTNPGVEEITGSEFWARKKVRELVPTL